MHFDVLMQDMMKKKFITERWFNFFIILFSIELNLRWDKRNLNHFIRSSSFQLSVSPKIAENAEKVSRGSVAMFWLPYSFLETDSGAALFTCARQSIC